MWPWTRKIPPLTPPDPQVQIFIRYCNYSSASAHKKRPPFFDRKACYDNLLATRDERVKITCFLDQATPGHHFIQGSAIEIREGTEAGSFLRMLEWVEKLDLTPNTLVYFLEDDYLHRPGWVDVLFEGFSLPGIDYVTLYDDPDKYRDYPKLTSKLFVTSTCHWRTTPSTTNTYAMRFATLQEDIKTHRQFSLHCKITKDYEKFCALRKKGRTLVSSLPGWSTHCEIPFLSPCTAWETHGGC